ncbi:MAG: flagellar protein FlaG [Candidatus Krumholzibacteriia bacterium]
MATISRTQGSLDPRLTGQMQVNNSHQAPKAAVRTPTIPQENPAGELEYDPRELDRALAELETHLQSLNRGHEVGIHQDPDTGATVVVVRDGDGNLIRQFPPEKLLNLRRKLDDLSGMVIDTVT